MAQLHEASAHLQATLAHLHQTLAAPVHALPLDVFRVLAGAVLFVYFLRTLRQGRDFTDPDGLIDHDLCAKLLPPTRWSLFHPGMSRSVFRSAHLGACAASLFVAVGFHPRAFAAYLFLIAASTYRWNVLVAYLDDAIVHVVCLWLVLLPVGSTLTLPDLLAPAAVAAPGVAGDPSALPADWLAATVPGIAPRAFLANMALVYLVAGLYKFTSPMWRDGSAMHAALKMPVSRAPDFWTLRHRSPLRVVTWAALVLEPLFVLVFVLPDGSSAKWALGACAAVFHLGIVATLKIPYSNLLMLAALAVPFGPEITGQAAVVASPVVPAAAPPPSLPELAALALVAALVLMFAWEAVHTRRRLGKPYAAGAWTNPVCPVLWLAGIFQSYRLFDWVDDRNYHVRYELRRPAQLPSDSDAPAAPPSALAPPSTARAVAPPPALLAPPAARSLFPGGMRYLLLQSYLIGNVWLQLDDCSLAAVRRSLLVRHAERFARLHREESGDLEVHAVVQRVTADNLDLARPERRFLMRFAYRNGKAVVDPESRHPDPESPLPGPKGQ